MLNYLKIIIVLHTQMGYISDSNTLKTNCVINSAASLVYFDTDHRIPLLIPLQNTTTFNSMILILCSREDNIEYPMVVLLKVFRNPVSLYDTLRQYVLVFHRRFNYRTIWRTNINHHPFITLSPDHSTGANILTYILSC